MTELVEAADDKLFQLTLKDNHNIPGVSVYSKIWGMVEMGTG